MLQHLSHYLWFCGKMSMVVDHFLQFWQKQCKLQLQLQLQLKCDSQYKFHQFIKINYCYKQNVCVIFEFAFFFFNKDIVKIFVWNGQFVYRVLNLRVLMQGNSAYYTLESNFTIGFDFNKPEFHVYICVIIFSFPRRKITKWNRAKTLSLEHSAGATAPLTVKTYWNQRCTSIIFNLYFIIMKTMVLL